MKDFHLALSLAQFRCRGETFADGLPVHFAGQAEIWAVAGLTRPMAMAIGFPAAAFDGGDRAATKISQMKDAHQNIGTLLFQGVEGIRQRAPPIRTYTYVRIITHKKEILHIFPCMSRTRCNRVCDIEVEVTLPGVPPSSPQRGR